MGQNIRAIQQVVLNLQNHRLITTRQAQQFMRDYDQKSGVCSQIQQFLKFSNLSKFLKYYVNVKYPTSMEANQRHINKHRNESEKHDYQEKRGYDSMSRQQIQTQIFEFSQNQIRLKLNKKCEQIQRIVQGSIKRACMMVIDRNFPMITHIAKQILKKCLLIQQFTIWLRKSNMEISYQSQIDYLSSRSSFQAFLQAQQQQISKQQIVFRYSSYSLTKIYKYNKVYLRLQFTPSFAQIDETSEEQTIKEPDEKEKKMDSYSKLIIEFTTANQQSTLTYEKLLNYNRYQESDSQKLRDNEKFINKFVKVVGGFIEDLSLKRYSHLRQIQMYIFLSIANRVSNFCSLIFNAIQCYLMIEMQNTNKLIHQLCKEKEISQYQNFNPTLYHLEDKCQSSCRHKQLIGLFNKIKNKLFRSQQIIKQYQSIVQCKQQFLEFDRYSELKFCFINSSTNNQLLKRLRICCRQSRTKIIDILENCHILINKMRDIANGQIKPCQTIHLFDNDIQIKIQVSQNSTLQKVIVLFQNNKNEQHPKIIIVNQVSDYSQTNNQNDENVSENKINNSVSRMQQRLVKKMQKQDPNLKVTGWLKLFIKQPELQLDSSKQKQQNKWSVTDIERFDSVDNNLNVLELSDRQQIDLVINIMKNNSFFNSLLYDEVNSLKFENFINQVKFQYSLSKNKFHNFTHAVNVLHMCSIFTHSQKIQQHLSQMEMFSILVSGLCHDVGHTGFSNAFQVASYSQRALTYNDISPLQNYQASKTIQILRQNKNNFMGGLERQKLMQFKQNLIQNILSTDMNEHFKIITKFQEWMKLGKEDAKKQPSVLTTMIVHTSDFAGACKQFSIAKQWSHRLYLQLQAQQQNEKKLGIKIGQSSNNEDLATWASNQFALLKFIVLPLYKEICIFCISNDNIKANVQKIENNMIEWEKMINKMDSNDTGQ